MQQSDYMVWIPAWGHPEEAASKLRSWDAEDAVQDYIEWEMSQDPIEEDELCAYVRKLPGKNIEKYAVSLEYVRSHDVSVQKIETDEEENGMHM